MTGLSDIINGGETSSSSTTTQPSLASVVADTAPAPEPTATEPAVPAQPAAPTTPDPASQSPAESEQAAFDFRSQMQTLGVDTSQFEDESDLFSAYTEALTHASEILNDEGYQEYLKTKQAPEDPPVTPPTPEPPAAAAPESAAPAEKPGDSLFQTAAVSDTARRMAEQGFITRNEKGAWSATDPAFQKFAEEYTNHDIAVRTNVMRFSEDPTSYISQIVKSLAPAAQPDTAEENETIKSLQAELAELKSWRDSQQQSHQEQTIEQWRKTAPIRTEDGSLTPYAQEYLKWEAIARQSVPTGTNLDVHQKTLEFLDLAGVTAEPPAASSEEPKPKKKSFVEQTNGRSSATNSNGKSTNRIKDYAGNAPASDPAVLTGKGGLPSLSATIAQQETPLT